MSWGHSGGYPAEEGGERSKRKVGGTTTATDGGGGHEGGGKSGGKTFTEGGNCRKGSEKSDTDTEAGEEAGTSQLQYKKGHMTNIYLNDSDEEAIVEFVKDHMELCDKTFERFKDKARK